jgi:hypothetical protein
MKNPAFSAVFWMGPSGGLAAICGRESPIFLKESVCVLKF